RRPGSRPWRRCGRRCTRARRRSPPAGCPRERVPRPRRDRCGRAPPRIPRTGRRTTDDTPFFRAPPSNRAVPPRPRAPTAAHHPSTRSRPRRPRTESRSEDHTSELQSRENLVCRLLLEKKKKHNKKLLTIKKKILPNSHQSKNQSANI